MHAEKLFDRMAEKVEIAVRGIDWHMVVPGDDLHNVGKGVSVLVRRYFVDLITRVHFLGVNYRKHLRIKNSSTNANNNE